MNTRHKARQAATGIARAVAAVVFCVTTACNTTHVTDASDTGGPPTALTALPRALTANEVQIRDAANDFSFRLMGTVSDAQTAANVFISPLSTSFALGMTMNGAGGTTLTEMQGALQLGNLTQPQMNAAYNSLLTLLVSIDPSVKFQIANSIWYRNSFPFNQAFIDTTQKYFFAKVQALNFSDRSTSLAAINNWVYSATGGRITKVLDTITDDQVMFLLNAIYFKGSWREKFDAARTTGGTFTTASGGTQPVQLMQRTGAMLYRDAPTYQAVDLPYGNSAFSMTVVLPKAGGSLNDVVRNFTNTTWQALTASMTTATVNLSLPKIKLAYERQLNSDLKTLGMRTAFTDAADFSRLSTERLLISFVKQNTFVDINEDGTEAAAVTSVGVGTTSVPLAVTMRVDHPYLFVIRERLSGTLIFMGRITGVPQ